KACQSVSISDCIKMTKGGAKRGLRGVRSSLPFPSSPDGVKAKKMPDVRLSSRERLVLNTIIELYIATGEPVASQAAARVFGDREGLSSATVRNVMAALGEAGFLDQPHTSAGRVPTALAFRYYVEQITKANRGAGAVASGTTTGSAEIPLSAARRGQIEESYGGVTSTNEYLERTSHVLA